MYDNKGSGSLSKDELTQALSTKGSNGFFKLTDSLTLVECIVEEIFEASNVNTNSPLLSKKSIFRSHWTKLSLSMTFSLPINLTLQF